MFNDYPVAGSRAKWYLYGLNRNSLHPTEVMTEDDDIVLYPVRKSGKFIRELLCVTNIVKVRVTLPSSRILDNGLKCIMGSEERTAIRTNVFDLDSISAYPSAGVACNISKQTTKKELINIEGIDKDEFLYDNINLFSGTVNALEYCNNMFNFMSLLEIDEELIKMGLVKN